MDNKTPAPITEALVGDWSEERNSSGAQCKLCQGAGHILTRLTFKTNSIFMKVCSFYTCLKLPEDSEPLQF